MSRENWRVGLLLGLFIFTVFLSIGDKELSLRETQLGIENDLVAGKGIALLELQGPISFSEQGGMLHPYSAEGLLRQLSELEEDKRVKGVLIRINSPGGTVGASQELYQGILNFKEKTGLPVVASIADIGTSGAYYTAMAADVIFANPGSLVGSIGVIMNGFNVEKLAQRFGVDVAVYKSGPHKDILSSWRETTAKEKGVLNQLVMNVHQQFVKDVMTARKLSATQAKKATDGRFFSGEQAKELGLVDYLNGMEAALEHTAILAGIKGEPEIIYRAKRGFGGLVNLLRQMGPQGALNTWLSSMTSPRIELR